MGTPIKVRDTTDNEYKPVTGSQSGDKLPMHVSQATLLSGEDQEHDVLVVEQGQFDYEVVSDDTGGDKPLGAVGAAGDFLHRLIFPQQTATGNVVLKDGVATVMTFLPGITAGTNLPLNMISKNGAWQINNLGDVDVIAVGRFS